MAQATVKEVCGAPGCTNTPRGQYVGTGYCGTHQSYRITASRAEEDDILHQLNQSGAKAKGRIAELSEIFEENWIADCVSSGRFTVDEIYVGTQLSKEMGFDPETYAELRESYHHHDSVRILEELNNLGLSDKVLTEAGGGNVVEGAEQLRWFVDNLSMQGVDPHKIQPESIDDYTLSINNPPLAQRASYIKTHSEECQAAVERLTKGKRSNLSLLAQNNFWEALMKDEDHRERFASHATRE